MLSDYPEYAEQLEDGYHDDSYGDGSNAAELDLREARLVMQVELLSHLLRTVSSEILQIPAKPSKVKVNLDSGEAAEYHYGKPTMLTCDYHNKD